VFELLEQSDEMRARLVANTQQFRRAVTAHGFNVPVGDHPIVPIMLGDAALASRMASELLDEGVYVIGFSYPVVPKGKARIRVQLSAAHEPSHIDAAAEAFKRVGQRLGVLK